MLAEDARAVEIRLRPLLLTDAEPDTLGLLGVGVSGSGLGLTAECVASPEQNAESDAAS